MGDVDDSMVTLDSEEEHGRRPRMGDMDMESDVLSQSESDDEVNIAGKDALTRSTFGANAGGLRAMRTAGEAPGGKRSEPHLKGSPVRKS